jgi:diacylglycerol kinase (ATP)
MHGSVHLFDRLPEVARPAVPLSPGAAPARQVPLVGVIRNLRSHLQGGPFADWHGRADVLVETPDRRRELQDVLARFAERRVDCLVVAGGDGTVRDVLTSGSGYFGDDWPPLIILPCGKTNALAVDLDLPSDWSMERALEALSAGRVAERRPLVVAQRDNPDARVVGFVFGAGAYVGAIQLGQRAHDKGAFHNLGVGITAAWSLGQALFGRAGNPWRQGAPMRLYDDAGAELPHCGFGPSDQRYMLFASTLGRFPAGIKPFGGRRNGLQTAVLDSAHRGLLLRLPLVFRGLVSPRMRRFGYHVLDLDALGIDIGDRFILDGEAFPRGEYRLSLGPRLRFVVP